MIFKILVQRSINTKYCPLDCQAGGTCVYIQSTPKCRCPKGQTGRLCESRMFKIHLISSTYSFFLFVGSGKSLFNEEDELEIL